MAGGFLGARAGRWEFRLLTGGRLLARIPFVVASLEQVLASVEVVSFDIVGVDRAGRCVPMSDHVSTQWVRSIVPAMELHTPLPFDRELMPISLTAYADGRKLALVSEKYPCPEGVLRLMPGSLPMDSIAANPEPPSIRFDLAVAGRLLASRTLSLRGPQTSAEGDLSSEEGGMQTVRTSQAEVILASASQCKW